jgi:hypothetical protein
MPEVDLVRARWEFLLRLQHLCVNAKSFPTVEGVDQGHYGSLSVNDAFYLTNEITMLRSDFKFNIIKQQQLFGGDQSVEWDSRLQELRLESQSLLEELQDLVDPKVCDIKDLEDEVGITLIKFKSTLR